MLRYTMVMALRGGLDKDDDDDKKPTRHYVRFRISTYGRRALSIAGPMVWNSLPDCVRDRTISADCYTRIHKMHVFARY